MTKNAAALDEKVYVSLLKAEVRRWAERIGAEPKEVHVRPMKKKWASCSSAGRLTFDSAILRQPISFRDQVIVHELIHLKVPNHGPLFRSLLRAHLGDAANGPFPDVGRRWPVLATNRRVQRGRLSPKKKRGPRDAG
jgi:hypothetical protein